MTEQAWKGKKVLYFRIYAYAFHFCCAPGNTSRKPYPAKGNMIMGNQELANNNAFDTDEIRQIQALIVLCSCLPPDGKLREVLQHALTLPHESWLARVTPASDTSFHGLKTWLETLWAPGTLSTDEQKLVEFQQSQENISAAVRELKAAEQQIGLKFGVPAFSEQPALSKVHAQ